MNRGNSIAVMFALSVALTSSAYPDQNPRRLQEPGLMITQGPGSDIRATVREIRERDQRPDGVRGVVIAEVVRNGPAHSAGLMVGDIVVEFDRVLITDPAQFRRIVRDTPPDRAVTIVFWRDGERREAKITPTFAKPQ